jgi:2-polyprenyl-3-methyl-5-hydroxy-6-metoxy-1,4-benzoquinol methylase
MTKTSLPANFVKHINKNPLQKFLINNFFSSLISLIKPLGVKSILDAGCGEGFTMDKLLEEKIANRIEGIEYVEESVILGKKLYPNLIIKQANIYNLPYKDSSFDLVICTEVLEHLKEPEKALREVLRVSKKYLIISVPNEPFFILSNFLRGKNILRLGNDPGHINHWGLFGLKDFLKKNGLKIDEVRLPFPWTIVLGEK